MVGSSDPIDVDSMDVDMSLKEAYVALGTSEDVDDDVVRVAFEFQVHPLFTLFFLRWDKGS